MDILQFTPTQRRILAVLADGMGHTKEELRACLNDDQAEPNVIYTHICFLRKKLRPIGQDIFAVSYGRRTEYRQVRLLANSE